MVGLAAFSAVMVVLSPSDNGAKSGLLLYTWPVPLV